MNQKLFSLQQRIGYTLIDKLETGEISLDRATEISKRVLEIIPENSDDQIFSLVVDQLKIYPELKGLEFGL